MSDLWFGDDGEPRCGWCKSSPDYVAYHDTEWGKPVHGDQAIFERLSLEGFQSGLSWITILRKRENFRSAFAGFDPVKVAQFTAADEARLMQDAGIVRNRLKIEATISNARVLTRLWADHGEGVLDNLVWSFAPTQTRFVRNFSQITSQTPESVALAKALKKLGWRFCGPTTAYAAMQAMGLVNDHLEGCTAQ